MKRNVWRLTSMLGSLAIVGYPAILAASTVENAAGVPKEPESGNAAPGDMAFDFPVIVEGQVLGDVTATVVGERVTAVLPQSLLQSIGSRLGEDAATKLRELGEAMASVATLRLIGIDVNLDPRTLALQVNISSEARSRQVFDGSTEIDYDGKALVRPNNFAAGVTTSIFATERLSDGRKPAVQASFAGFANVGGATGLNLLYGGTVGLSGGGGFQRERLILFKDDPKRIMRFSAGDLAPIQSRLAGQFDLAGISVERSYSELQPQRNVRPTGNRSFSVERPSTIEVFVNGQLVERFQAQPGPVNIRNVVSGNLTSEVSIVVEDSLGRRELDRFELGNDIFLLDKGLSEFSFAGGVLREVNSNGFAYSNKPVGSFFYSRGVSSGLTVSGSLIASKDFQSVGAGLAFASLRGVGQLEVAGSRHDATGSGVAVGLGYRGDPLGMSSRNGILNLQVDYQSRNFRRLDSFALLNSFKLDALADYRFDLNSTMSFAVGGTYFEQYGQQGRDIGAFATLTKRFGRISASATARHFSTSSGRDRTGFLVTLSMPLGRRNAAFASYDSLSETARTEFRRRRSLDLPEFEYAVRASHSPSAQEVGANAGFANSRFQLSSDAIHQFARNGNASRSNVNLRLTTGLAFTDGRFGIGRDPGRGFAMISKHPSLKGATIAAKTGASGREVGFANAFGPAVVPLFAPYRPQELTVSSDNAPDGYNLGPGEYVFFPAGRSGLSVIVGSDANRSIIGYLKAADGKPLALITGRLFPQGGGQPVSFFTNRNGRFVADGLTPGRYRVMVDGSEIEFTIDVGGNVGEQVDLGEIIAEPKP